MTFALACVRLNSSQQLLSRYLVYVVTSYHRVRRGCHDLRVQYATQATWVTFVCVGTAYATCMQNLNVRRFILYVKFRLLKNLHSNNFQLYGIRAYYCKNHINHFILNTPCPCSITAKIPDMPSVN